MMLRVCLLFLCLLAGWQPVSANDAMAQGGHISTEQYLARVFGPNQIPSAGVLWPKAELRTALQKILGHQPPLRFRYWGQGAQTVWVLNEIGKERPITAGITVRDGKITDIAVLAFRESRGWEIKYEFFTRQFQGVALQAKKHKLTSRIDGITGATLSVNAMTRMAKASLLLHEHSDYARPTTAARALAQTSGENHPTP